MNCPHCGKAVQPEARPFYTDGYRKILNEIENMDINDIGRRELVDRIHAIAQEEYRRNPLDGRQVEAPQSPLAPSKKESP